MWTWALPAVLAASLVLTSAAMAQDKKKTSVDFRQLDQAAARAAACDEKAGNVYDADSNAKILENLNAQAKCLEVVLFSIAREFYDLNAFGDGGVEARIADVRRTLGHLYKTIYSEPRTCAPNCGEVYQIWAQEAYVTSIRIMVDDMVDRLKDESPYHRP